MDRNNCIIKSAVAAFACLAGHCWSAELQLAENGTTGYRIVKPDQPTAVDEYAVNALSDFLFQKTGARFPVIPPDRFVAGNRQIFVGLSKPALKILGEQPLAALKAQEYVVRSIDRDIFL